MRSLCRGARPVSLRVAFTERARSAPESISVPSRSKIRTRTSAKGAVSELDVEACIEAKNYSSRNNIEARSRKVREFLCHGQGALVKFLLFGADGRQC